jgi:hypothetical protein
MTARSHVWILVREGHYRYFMAKNGPEAYSPKQKRAIRFKTKAAAERCAKNVENAYLSSWPVRDIRLWLRPSLRDGGRHDWFCHYCGGEKPRGKLCTCRGAHIHARVEQIEKRLGITELPKEL